LGEERIASPSKQSESREKLLARGKKTNLFQKYFPAMTSHFAHRPAELLESEYIGPPKIYFLDQEPIPVPERPEMIHNTTLTFLLLYGSIGAPKHAYIDSEEKTQLCF